MAAGKKILPTVVLVCFACHPAVSYPVEFNLDVMDVEERDSIDLSRFRTANYIMPGEYLMSIRVNGRVLSEQTIHFYPSNGDEAISRACVPMDLAAKFGLKPEILQGLGRWPDRDCAELGSVGGITLRPDMEAASLVINIPQAWMAYRDPNWAPVEEWDNGIPGALLDYNLNGSTHRDRDSGRSHQISGNGTAGFNMGAWRLRGDFQGSRQRSKQYTQREFAWSRIYAYRPLPRQGARLLLGETQLNSNLFDSFRYLGASLATDDQMLPPDLRGYAPEVTGVAQSNAKVTVRQGDRVLYETTVPPGPFRISDINSAVSGKLDVEVSEDDGHVQRFQIETTNMPYMSRPGQLRYKLAVGRPANQDREMTGPMFASGELSWGVDNNWSTYGGSLLTDGYTALAVGVGRNLQRFGVVSADITNASAKVRNEPRQKGNSLRINYAKRFDEYNSEITFAGYRFSERSFVTMDEFLDARDGRLTRNNSKAVYTALANKAFIDFGFSGHLSYTREDYWDRASTERFSAYFSRYFDVGRIKGLSATLSLSHSRSDLEQESSVSLSLSVPFGRGERVGYDNFINRDGVRHGATYSRYEQDYNYLLSANTGRGNDGMQGYFSARTSMADVGVSGSYQEGGSQNLGLSLRGGLTATAQGAALHQSAFDGGTRFMVDTDGVSGVPLQDGLARTNRLGIAVIPSANDYYRTDVRIDVNKLADDMEASKSVTEATLTEGAIGYRRLSVVQGSKALVTVRLPSGAFPPFGASVLDAAGREVTIVADSGFAYLTGIQPDSEFVVRWGRNKQCRLTMPRILPLDQRSELQCQPFIESSLFK
ncbi:fimbria/pilus outer membrane usher protein [Pseudomonas boanensis]|uniref:fimbria/pilus outer membrane usher protein n=1 Tax=Metapseudomonas boanensis TaxID=2822138 RepID=UPI0035D404A7